VPTAGHRVLPAGSRKPVFRRSAATRPPARRPAPLRSWSLAS